MAPHSKKSSDNGTEFVALTIDGSKRTRVRLTPEGGIIDSVVLGMPVGFGLGAMSDDGRRLLFVEWGGKRVAIADRHGEMAGAALALAPLPEDAVVRSWLAAERNGEFVIARFVSRAAWPDPTFDLIADRINAAGELISSVDTRLPVEFDENYVMAGGPDGYLFVTQKWTEPAVIAYRLDAAGVFIGSSITLVPYDPDHRRTFYKPAAVRDGSRFLVVWHMSFNHGESEVRIAEIPDGATSATSQRLAIWPGITSRIAFCVRGTQRIVLVSVSVLNTISPPDLYSIRVAPSLTGEPPRLVAWSATAQKRIETATGDNGFGIVWVEDSPDNASHVYFRRVSRTGAMQGLELEVARIPAGTGGAPSLRVAVTSNGPVHVVVWEEGRVIRGRRIAAAGGEWLDAKPFTIGTGSFDPQGLASTSDEAALAYYSNGIAVQRIRFAGEPLLGESTIIERVYAYGAALASDGEDYLVVWSEGFRECQFLCFLEPFQILAARVAESGALLDSTPILLEDRVTYSERPSVAWAGDRYLVVWAGVDDDGGSVAGATLTRDAVVIDANPSSSAGIALDLVPYSDLVTPRVVASGDSFALLTSAMRDFPSRGLFGAVRFQFDTPLRNVASLLRRSIQMNVLDPLPAFAARVDGTILVGWTRESNDAQGRAPRAFFQIFGEQQRRRGVRP